MFICKSNGVELRSEYNIILGKYDHYLSRTINVLGNKIYQYIDKVDVVCKLKLKK